MKKLMIKIFTIICYLLLFNFSIKAENTGVETGFKIPRYVSLKSDDVNLRLGSGIKYPLVLKYKQKNLPVEIINEYEVWREVKDINGYQGWIHKNLLQGDRFGIIYKSKNSGIKIFNKPNGKKIAEIGKRNIVNIKVCLNYWCKINFKQTSGWVEKKYLWGVYKNEKFNIPIYQNIINLLWKINYNKFF